MKFLFVLLLSISYCNAQELILATSEYPPEHGKTLENGGYVTHLVKTALERKGYVVKVKFYQVWERAIAETVKGEAHLIATLGKKEARMDVMDISDTVVREEVAFYYNKKNPLDWSIMEDLIGLKVGHVGNYYYGVDFQLAKRNEVFVSSEVTRDIFNVKKLAAGRIDVAPLTTGVAEYMMLNMLPDKFKGRIARHPKVVHNYGSYVYFSRKTPNKQRVLSDFNESIATMIEDGSHAEIIGGGLEEWKNKLN